ncbi:MAG: hypothetical protein Kow0058_01170 [Roseovarius sp.]
MFRAICLPFASLFLCLSSSLTCVAQGADITVFLAEQELERACARVESAADTHAAIVRSHMESLADSAEAADGMLRIVSNTGRAYVSQGILSEADYQSLIQGGLRFHPEPRVRELVDAMRQRAALIERADRAAAEAEARIEGLAVELNRLRQRKEDLKRRLEDLQSNQPSGGIIGTGEPPPDFRTDEEILDAVLHDLTSLNDRMDALEQNQATLLEQEQETHAAEIERLSDLIAGVPGEGGASTGNPPSYPRLGIAFGAPLDTDLTFTGFGQQLNTNDRWALMLNGSWPIHLDFGPWAGFWTANYSRIEMDQFSHINVATGVPGPSAGSISFDYLGLGLAFERQVSRHGRLGLGAGLGALVADVGGSFHASGTVGAARLDAYYLVDIQSIPMRNGSLPLSGGPFVSVIFPFDGVGGGAGPLLSDLEMDPVIILGLQLALGAQR